MTTTDRRAAYYGTLLQYWFAMCVLGSMTVPTSGFAMFQRVFTATGIFIFGLVAIVLRSRSIDESNKAKA